MKRSEDAYQIIWLLRRLFRALAQKSDVSLQSLGVTAADRAVMEFLYPEEKLSVPELAERYQVSRQHVQATVNNLLELGFLGAGDNPRHKRSSLIFLKPAGRSLFRKIMARDQKAVARLFRNVSTKDLHVTRRTLQTLLAETVEE